MALQSFLSVLHSFLIAFGKSLWSGFALLVAFIPLFVVGALLNWRKRRYKAQAQEPFTSVCVRPAGESLRLRIDELAEQYDMATTLLAVVPLIALGLVFLPGSNVQAHAVPFVAITMIGATALYGSRAFRLARQIWDHRLGLAGELAVAEVLNELRADGFKIFHDVPFDGFNIDHVLVAACGVYAVETKTRRKPSSMRGVAKATVVFDGQSLRFPWGVDIHGLEQAARNAKTLSQWLTSSTGERTDVGAILTLPGWWVERKDRGAVNVLNPKEIRAAVCTSRSLIAPGQVQRIAHQLAQRCQTEADWDYLPVQVARRLLPAYERALLHHR